MGSNRLSRPFTVMPIVAIRPEEKAKDVGPSATKELTSCGDSAIPNVSAEVGSSTPVTNHSKSSVRAFHTPTPNKLATKRSPLSQTDRNAGWFTEIFVPVKRSPVCGRTVAEPSPMTRTTLLLTVIVSFAFGSGRSAITTLRMRSAAKSPLFL